MCEWSEEAAAGPRTWRWRSVFGKSFQKQGGQTQEKRLGETRAEAEVKACSRGSLECGRG